MKLESYLDALIEVDPERAARFIEMALGRRALRKRLAEKKARNAEAKP